MFKKLALSGLVLASLFSVGNNTSAENYEVEATAIDFEPGVIFYGQETTTTSRVTLTSGKTLVIDSLTTGGSIQFRIYKNGVAYLDYPSNSSSFSNKVVPNATAGEYSLRAFCGDANNAKTNCAANYSISVK